MHYVENSESEARRIATEVRRRRQQRQWTLDTAALRLGVSRRLLAQIEAGDANPSLSSLLSIAEGFDISLVELLAKSEKRTVVVQPDNETAPILWTGERGGAGRLLVGSDPLELWQWTMEPGEERRSDAHRTGARESLSVTAGSVTISVGAADPVVVTSGQSALFNADEPHSYRNDGDDTACFVLAVHEPSGGAA